MKEFFKLLAKNFGEDKEYAHSYMEGHTVSRLAAQVHALRKQRGWSQEKLAHITGIAQERISKIESADFNSLTIKTLQKFSQAFDVNLFIAFDSFSKGIIDVANLSKERLEIESRERDLETNFTEDTKITFTNREWRLSNHVFVVKTAPTTQIIEPFPNTWHNLGQTAPIRKVATQ